MSNTVHARWQLARLSVLPVDRVGRRQFFFEEQLPDAARNVHHAYAPVEKLGVILEGDAPWEGGSVSTFPVPVYTPGKDPGKS